MICRCGVFILGSLFVTNLYGQEVSLNLDITMNKYSEPFGSATLTVQKVLPLTASRFDLTLLGQTEVLSDGSLAKLHGSAFVSDHHMGLSFTVDSITGNESTADLSMMYKTSDSWRLVPRFLDSVLPAGLGMKANLFARANINYTTSYAGSEESIGSPSRFEISTGIDIKEISMPSTIFWNGGNKSINQAIGVQWSSAGQMSGNYGMFWSTTLLLGPDSSLDFDAPHSFVLDSVVFDDGTTPEEHGFDLVFGSGRPSPNVIAAVPEPSSLAAVFLVLLIFSALRKLNKIPRCHDIPAGVE